jgi:predicted GIY-YIG superfamily endonuclease
MSQLNAIIQARWYKRQKNNGIVYGLSIDDALYVGSTTNSLKKRLWQHKAGALAATRHVVKTAARVYIFQLDCMEEFNSQLLKEKEQFWIDKLQPSLNKNDAVRKPRPAPTWTYKGGVEFEGTFYRTRLLLWRERGRTLYGTFKSRLHRYPHDYAHALGLAPSSYKIKSKLVERI